VNLCHVHRSAPVFLRHTVHVVDNKITIQVVVVSAISVITARLYTK